MITKEIILMLLPIIIIQISLAVYCIIKILKEGVEIGNQTIWIVIVSILNLIGPILFLIIGRKKNVEYQEPK